jgi:hypothetical protein
LIFSIHSLGFSVSSLQFCNPGTYMITLCCQKYEGMSRRKTTLPSRQYEHQILLPTRRRPFLLRSFSAEPVSACDFFGADRSSALYRRASRGAEPRHVCTNEGTQGIKPHPQFKKRSTYIHGSMRKVHTTDVSLVIVFTTIVTRIAACPASLRIMLPAPPAVLPLVALP